IKPSNIIIDTNGVAYVTDFGLARMAQLGDSTLSHDVLLGTPHYISPEQAMGSRDLDSRTDLYSLGVVLFELVVGRVPFSADTPFAVIHDQIYRPLPKPSSINPEITPAVDAVLEKALAKAPADRYATATEMIDAFGRAAAQSGMTTLDPDRSSIAAESLAKLHDARTLPPTPVESSAAPATEEAAPSQPAPAEPEYSQDEDDDSPAAWIRGFPTPPVPPIPPSRREVRKAQRQMKQEARREARRVIEASFDLSDAERAIQSVGNAVRNAVEGFSSSWDRTNDPDFMPLDDEEAIRKRIEVQFSKRREFFGHLVAYVTVNLFLLALFGTGIVQNIVGDMGGILNFPIVPVVMLAWGSGLAAHAIETYYVTGQRAASRLNAIQDEFYREFGPDWRRANRKDLRRVRDRVNAALNKRREFVQHLAVYLCINVMLWVIFFASASVPFLSFAGGFPWPLIVMLGWGIGLVSHGFEAITSISRERAISRAVERERDRLYDAEKPKRDRDLTDPSDRSFEARGTRDVRLTEDGEFTDSMIADIEADEKAKRDRR
ncbi:MAG: 2TM domain-containing protein, partial [Anaerolineae bacterium]|nr:2TM domain-containing protein [Anaerolineae bacterium]